MFCKQQNIISYCFYEIEKDHFTNKTSTLHYLPSGGLYVSNSDGSANMYNVPTTYMFDRGYTGHEMLDAFGLINANGRIYEPATGRFLSPDDFVQSPDFSQSFNRYAYCWNNPLKYTDPDGEFIIPMIIGAGLGYYFGSSFYMNNFNIFQKSWWSGQDEAWKSGVTFALVGASIGAGVSAFALGWADKGTIFWNALSNGLLTSDINMLSSFARGQELDMVMESGLIGFAAGAIGGAIGGPISDQSAGVQSNVKSWIWNKTRPHRLKDVTWTMRNLRTVNTITAMTNGGIDRYLISSRKGYSVTKSLWHGVLGATEGFLASQYFTSKRFYPGFISKSLNPFSLTYLQYLISTVAVQGTTSIPRLGFDLALESIVHWKAKNIYGSHPEFTPWYLLDYGLTLGIKLLYPGSKFYGSYPGYLE